MYCFFLLSLYVDRMVDRYLDRLGWFLPSTPLI